MFETFEHTADLGLRVRAATLNELFAEAGLGLFSMVVEVFATIEPREQYEINIAGSDREYLFFDWLKELLYRFDSAHRLFRRFDVCVNDDGLTAQVWGEQLDWERHVMSHEVKAITYHGLKVEERSEGWFAEVIVDI